MYIGYDDNEGTTWLISEYLKHFFGMDVVDMLI